LIRIPKIEEDIWEAIQLTNGSVYVYHGGFTEEALIENVFEYIPGPVDLCFGFRTNRLEPIKNGYLRLNRAVIVFAWYVDPNSSIVQEFKKIIEERKVK
jgi:hypothetical protein